MAIGVTKMSCRMGRQWDVPSGAIRQSRRDPAITSGIEAAPLRADFANLFGDDDG